MLTTTERVRRHRAKKRGESVPTLKRGRPEVERFIRMLSDVVWNVGTWRIKRTDEYKDPREKFARRYVLQVLEKGRWRDINKLRTREDLYLLIETIAEFGQGEL